MLKPWVVETVIKTAITKGCNMGQTKYFITTKSGFGLWEPLGMVAQRDQHFTPFFTLVERSQDKS